MKRCIRTRIAILLVASSLLAAGCSSSHGGGVSTPGVTATSVTIGSHQPLTGPASPGYSELAPAAKAYFDYVNAHGGVHGRKIVYKYLDDAFNPSSTVNVVHQLVEQDKVFAIFNGLGTATHTKVVGYLNAQKVPDLFVATGCSCWDQPATYPYTFGFALDYIREGKVLGSYIKSAFANKRIAYLWQAGQAGADGVAGLDKVVPTSWVVSRQTYEPSDISIEPQVTALAQARPDVIVFLGTPQFGALLRKSQLAIGNTAQVMMSYTAAEPNTLATLLNGVSPSHNGTDLIQGIVTDGFLPVFGSGSSWDKIFSQVRDQYAPSLPKDGFVMAGMAAAYTFVQALQAAGREPTRQSIVAAVEKGGFIGPGLVPFGFSRSSHAGYTGTQIRKIQGRTLASEGNPMITDDGAGPVVPYAAPVAEAPVSGIPNNG